MIITYKNRKAEQSFASAFSSSWRYPKDVILHLKKTENFINNATSLQDIVCYRPFRFHPLQGQRKGEWSITLGNTKYRVTLIPCDEEGKKIINGDIISKCKEIKIIMVTEVSNHYE